MMRPFLAHRMPTLWADRPVSAMNCSSSDRRLLLMSRYYTLLRALQRPKLSARKPVSVVVAHGHERRLGRQAEDSH